MRRFQEATKGSGSRDYSLECRRQALVAIGVTHHHGPTGRKPLIDPMGQRNPGSFVGPNPAAFHAESQHRFLSPGEIEQHFAPDLVLPPELQGLRPEELGGLSQRGGIDHQQTGAFLQPARALQSGGEPGRNRVGDRRHRTPEAEEVVQTYFSGRETARPSIRLRTVSRNASEENGFSRNGIAPSGAPRLKMSLRG
jgi:hypothetical protein